MLPLDFGARAEQLFWGKHLNAFPCAFAFNFDQHRDEGIMENFVQELLTQVPLAYQPAVIALTGLAVAIIITLIIRSLSGGNEKKAKRSFAKRLKADQKIQNETYQQADAEASKWRDALQDDAKAIVIEMIHDTDFDEYRPDAAPPRISFDEAFQTMRRIEKAASGDIFLILHTLGGYSMPSIMIADAIRKHRANKGKVIAFVPRVAMSGGTIAALACDQVWMGDTARLGPIDTMFGGISGQSFRDMKDLKPSEKHDDHTILYALEAKKYDISYQKELKRLIDMKNLDPRIYDGSVSHSNLFNVEDAEDYGVRVFPRNSKLSDKDSKKDQATKDREAVLKEFGKIATTLVDLKLTKIKNFADRVEGEKPDRTIAAEPEKVPDAERPKEDA